MTTGYGCAREECANKVNWIITRISPPGTISACDEDMPMFVIPLLAGELGVDPGKFYDSIKRFTDRAAAAQAKEQAKAAGHDQAAGHDGEPPAEEYDPGPQAVADVGKSGHGFPMAPGEQVTL